MLLVFVNVTHHIKALLNTSQAKGNPQLFQYIQDTPTVLRYSVAISVCCTHVESLNM